MKRFYRSRKNRVGAVSLALVLVMLLGIAVFQPTKAVTELENSEIKTVVEIEQEIPEQTVDFGTTETELGLPYSVRAVVQWQAEGKTFLQGDLLLGNPEEYGYTLLEEVSETAPPSELAVYFLEKQDGSTTYRIFGGYGDEAEAAWYASDAEGNVLGKIEIVPVEWKSEEYRAEEAGIYPFTGMMDASKYEGADILVTTSVEVLAAEKQTEEEQVEQETEPAAEEETVPQSAEVFESNRGVTPFANPKYAVYSWISDDSTALKGYYDTLQAAVNYCKSNPIIYSVSGQPGKYQIRVLANDTITNTVDMGNAGHIQIMRAKSASEPYNTLAGKARAVLTLGFTPTASNPMFRMTGVVETQLSELEIDGANIHSSGSLVYTNAYIPPSGTYSAAGATVFDQSIVKNFNGNAAPMFQIYSTRISIDYNSQLINNRTTHTKGLIYVNGSSPTIGRLEIRGGAVIDNNQAVNGGVGYAENQGFIDVYNAVKISNNRASGGSGGAFYFTDNSSFRLISGSITQPGIPTFTGNSADQYGGVIYCAESSKISFNSGFVMTGNRAGMQGGAIYNNGQMSMSFNNSKLTSQLATVTNNVVGPTVVGGQANNVYLARTTVNEAEIPQVLTAGASFVPSPAIHFYGSMMNMSSVIGISTNTTTNLSQTGTRRTIVVWPATAANDPNLSREQPGFVHDQRTRQMDAGLALTGYQITKNQEAGSRGALILENPPSSFSFFKRDEQSETTPVAGAVFKLYKPGPAHTGTETLVTEGGISAGVWTLVGTQTSGADGKVDFGLIPDNQYVLVEAVAPVNYLRPSGTWTVLINSTAGKTIITGNAGADGVKPPNFIEKSGSYILPNRKADTEFTFKKVDSEYMDIALPNTRFVLTNLTTGATQTVIADANGVVKLSNLTQGSYDLKETLAIAGYVLPKGSWKITVNFSTSPVVNVQTVGDAPSFVASSIAGIDRLLPNVKDTGVLVIIKYDVTQPTKRLGNAQFEVLDSRGRTIKTGIKTDAVGYVSVPGIPEGNYTLKEIVAPQGYEVGASVPIKVQAGRTTWYSFGNQPLDG